MSCRDRTGHDRSSQVKSEERGKDRDTHLVGDACDDSGGVDRHTQRFVDMSQAVVGLQHQQKLRWDFPK